ARARQSDAARRGGTRDADAERHRIGRARIDVPNEELIGAPEFEGILVAPAGEQAAVPRETRHRQLAALLVDTNRLAADAAELHRREVDVVALLECDPVSVRRRNNLVSVRQREVHHAIAAVRSDRNERRTTAAAATCRSLAGGRGTLFGIEQSTFGPEGRTQELPPRFAAERRLGRTSDGGDDVAAIATSRGRGRDANEIVVRVRRDGSARRGRARAARDDD